jgi:hypothetical protein
MDDEDSPTTAPLDERRRIDVARRMRAGRARA